MQLQDVIVFLVAVGLIVLSAGQFLVSGYGWHRLRSREHAIRQTQLRRLSDATNVARLHSQLTVADAGQGKWRVMEVLKVVDEAADTKSFYLADPNQQPLPAFHPGQYLMIRPALAGKFQATRCYSLSVAPNSKLWRITVKQQTPERPLNPDRRNGGLSTWLHKNIHDGDCLLVGGPAGDFYLSAENRAPLVLLAAGVGITPMASMLQYSQHFTPSRQVSLYYQAKDAKHWPLGAEVHAYSKQTETCRAITYFSRIEGPALSPLMNAHGGEFRSGKFAAADIVREVAAPQAHYYLCGPDAWMATLSAELQAWQVPPDQIHWESFGGTPSIQTAATVGQKYAVDFRRSRAHASWENSDQSLWELAQANDICIPSGCLSGVCGACKTRLIKGQVSYDRAVSAGLADGDCLPCIARPKSDVELDA